MATAAKTTTKPAGTPVETGVSGSELWKLADTLRGNIDAAEYKHIVLPLMFLKYISDAFEELHQELESKADEGYDPEQPDEYAERNVFWVPMEARWSNIQSKARQEDIGATIDRAMDVIERENKPLQGVLPKNYGRDDLDKQVVGQVVDLVSNIKVGGTQAQATDVLGQVYEYFLEQFAIHQTAEESFHSRATCENPGTYCRIGFSYKSLRQGPPGPLSPSARMTPRAPSRLA